MKAVHILFREDTLDHSLLVDMPRQRQLHQDAMDGWVRIKLVQQRQKVRLGRIVSQPVMEGGYACFFARLDLVADVDLAGRVFTHKHHG